MQALLLASTPNVPPDSPSIRTIAKDYTVTTQTRGDSLWYEATLQGLALFLGTFTLLNLLAEAFPTGFDGNLWWIDLSAVTRLIARPFLAMVALVLIG